MKLRTRSLRLLALTLVMLVSVFSATVSAEATGEICKEVGICGWVWDTFCCPEGSEMHTYCWSFNDCERYGCDWPECYFVD